MAFHQNTDQVHRSTSGKVKISRIRLLAVLLLLAAFPAILLKTGVITLVRGDEYRAKAEQNQLLDTSITAMRGTIYDRNMNALAQSASGWLIYVNPSGVKGKGQSTQEKEAYAQQTRQEIASGLAGILGVSEESIMEKLMKTDSNYQRIIGHVERPQMEAVDSFRREEFRGENEDSRGFISVIGILDDSIRYYPNANMASTLIGFTGMDGNGLAGLEAKYDDELTGTDGRIVSAKDAKQNQLPNEYEITYEAQQGTSLQLTIDETVQYTLENALRQSMEDTSATYAYGIVMEVDTGAILGMVSLPDYDLNDPRTVTDEEIAAARALQEKNIEKASDEEKAKYEAMSEEEKNSLAVSAAQNAKWRNRAISDTYEPGSVFKCITVSAALEEGVVSEDYAFTCTGSILVADTIYNCWRHEGHGHETLPDLLMNSCNPFAITVARLLGTEKYYKYFEAFGFTEKTGIDLPGEASPVEGSTYHRFSDFGISQLSSYSFGQTFQVSPIQMITAISAIANGGKLMTPYVVAKELDEDGNVLSVTQPQVKRQVISESTAERVRSMMERVVSEGTGKNAYVAGYHVAGKTGTSEKLQNKGQYIASFVGFAPADDPQIAILIAIDEPQGEHGGGAIAAPVASQVLESILPYLNIEAAYSEDEMNSLISKCPGAVGMTVDEARSLLNGQGYTVRVRGEGDTVLSQIPEEGNQIPKDGIIILYTEELSEPDMVEVPDFTGCTESQVRSLAKDAGINVKLSGNTHSGSELLAYKQSAAVGQQVNAGTVVTVYFRTTVGVNDGTE